MRRIVPTVPDAAPCGVAPEGRYVLVGLRIAGGEPVLTTHSLAATFRPQLRRQFAKRGFLVPVYTFLPDRLVMVVERTDRDSDLSGAIDSFRRDSAAWMTRLRCASNWERDVELRAVPDAEFKSEVRRVLGLARLRNLTKDPYDYPYTGAVGHEIWRLLGDPEPEVLPGLAKVDH